MEDVNVNVDIEQFILSKDDSFVCCLCHDYTPSAHFLVKRHILQLHYRVYKKNATHRNKAKPKNTQKLPTHHFMKNGILSYLIFGAKSYFAILGHFWFFFFKATV